MDNDKIINLIERLYEAISGRQGEERKWFLLDEVCHPHSRMCIITTEGKAENNIEFLNNKEFRESFESIFHDPNPDFHEYQVDCEIIRKGNAIHVLSTYESKFKLDEKPFKRGVNSIQIMCDGNNYWIINVFWDRGFNLLR